MNGTAVYGFKSLCSELGMICHNTKNRVIEKMCDYDKNISEKLFRSIKSHALNFCEVTIIPSPACLSSLGFCVICLLFNNNECILLLFLICFILSSIIIRLFKFSPSFSFSIIESIKSLLNFKWTLSSFNFNLCKGKVSFEGLIKYILSKNL